MCRKSFGQDSPENNGNFACLAPFLTAPGSTIDLFSYSAKTGWHIYGQGEVTKNGKQIKPRPGTTPQSIVCLWAVGDPSDAPAEGPPPGSCAVDGDPVDLATGLFLEHGTDLALPDIIPIALTRTYRPKDTKSRPFGIGATHPYQMYLVGNTSDYDDTELILADGGRIRYDRISSGTTLGTAILEHTATPTQFYKSTLRWNSTGWDLKFKDGSQWKFQAYDGAAPMLLAISDRNGNTVSIIRTTQKQISKVLSPNGRWIEFTYDSSDRVTQAKDNIGRTVNYSYDASGRLWKVTDAAGGLSEYTYDTSHRMVTVKDARGIIHVTNQYDANGRVTQQTMADGGVYQFAYTLDGNGKVTQTDVTDPRGNHRIVTFNSSGYGLTDTKGCSCGSGVTYERQSGTNFITAVTDALGRCTQYAFDSMGNVTSVTRMSGTSEAVTIGFAYESNFNQIASITDPLNHTTAFTYDAAGNLTTVTDPLSHQTAIGYNTAGQPTSVTDPLGNTTLFSYDGGDLIDVTDPLGQRVKSFVDAAGRILSLTNPLGQTTRFEFDQLNRMTRATDPLQGVTQFSYDPNGNVLSLTDARNNVTSYVYSSMDRMSTRTDPLLHGESYQYNQNGALTQHTDRKSQVTTYTYDTLDRLSQVTYADASTITYTYDTVSRLAQVTDSISGTVTYAYDNLDRLLSETTPQGTVSYTYDAVGRRATMTVPGQAIVNYTYDNADRLTQITQASSTVTFAYDIADRRTSLTLPNGVITEYSYDAASRLTALTYKKSGVVLGNLTYVYDAAGQRTRVGGSFARTGLPLAVSTGIYNAANQQTAFGSQTLTFDLNGNLTSDGTNASTWNARDQLVSMSGSVTASFQYDPIGRRHSKTIGGVLTSFLYDGDNVVQEQSGSNSNILAGGLDEFFTRTDTSGTAWLILDAIGSTVALTDSAGAAQTQYTYEPFGIASASGTTSSNPSQYTNRENDGTGFYYYRARYYSPSLQRFISEDPVEFEAGDVNLYAYVGNNPVNFTDPLGLQKRSEPWISEEAFCRGLGLAGTYCAGFADHIDLGFSDRVRDWSGANNAVDKGHVVYTAGEITGYVWDVGMVAGASARAAGYSVKFNYYRTARGVGMNVLKGKKRCFAIDWHRFKLKSTGQTVNRLHTHWGKTKSQMKKHRFPWTGKPM